MPGRDFGNTSVHCLRQAPTWQLRYNRCVLDADATRALRDDDPEVLRAGLVRLIVRRQEEWARDWRDLLLALAPYHDCARRLGLDPAAVFDEAAEQAPASLREIVRDFGRRQDVTPGAFGFYVEDAPGGPRYRFAWPGL